MSCFKCFNASRYEAWNKSLPSTLELSHPERCSLIRIVYVRKLENNKLEWSECVGVRPRFEKKLNFSKVLEEWRDGPANENTVVVSL
jgi:hypothetical protein